LEATVPVTDRPSTSHAVAAVLNVAFSVFSVVYSLPVIQGGAANSDEVPYPIIILGFALGIIGVISSYGVWHRQRWGVVLTIVVNVVSFLTGAPGIIFGPTAFLVIGSIVGAVANIVIIYLLLRRSSVRADVGVQA
jgi:uncharacterized membrane protein (DUF2068 family)